MVGDVTSIDYQLMTEISGIDTRRSTLGFDDDDDDTVVKLVMFMIMICRLHLTPSLSNF